MSLNLRKWADGPTYKQLQDALWRGIISPIEFKRLLEQYGLEKESKLNRQYHFDKSKRLPLLGEKFDLPPNLPEGLASRSNLRKIAGVRLTQSGQELFDQASISNPRTGDIQWPEWIRTEISADVLEVLELVANNPDKTVQDLVRYAKEFGREVRESLQAAISRGYLTITEGIANRLSLKKKAIDIGGVEFPDYLHFDREESIGEDLAIGDIYSPAENWVVNYIWSNLSRYGVDPNYPDNIHIIMTGPDKLQFNAESPIIQELLSEGWINYLENKAPDQVRRDIELQKGLLAAIKASIAEGTI